MFCFSRRFGDFPGGRFATQFLVVLLCGAGLSGVAQTITPASDISVATVFPANEIAEVQPELFARVARDIELPEAPESQQQQRDEAGQAVMSAAPSTTNLPMAPIFSRVIPAGMATPQIHKWNKIELATRNLYSATSFASIFFSAGWSHLTNGQPNYGTNSEAFGQRVGAAAIRDSTQAFLSNGPFAVWLHQDPRYFALGRRYSFARRTWYAATRAIITRDSSDGHEELNSSLILGQAAGTALNNLYYPQSNRNFHDNIAAFGGSMGGSALSFVLDEFTSDLLRMVRLRHPERLPH